MGQLKTLAEPRDNMNIFPPRGNLHKSSYRRFGTADEGIGISETHTMLSQIERDEYKRIAYPRRSLFTRQSFVSAKENYKEESLKLMDIFAEPLARWDVDYCTTMEKDYRSPYPLKPKPPSVLPPSPEPWLLNRRTVGYSPHDLENRRGCHMFLDDNMSLHRRIAELKNRKNKRVGY